jgi:isoquinoline 1-oxidoreductase beta subunit
MSQPDPSHAFDDPAQDPAMTAVAPPAREPQPSGSPPRASGADASEDRAATAKPGAPTRRQFLGYLVAAPVLVAAARLDGLLGGSKDDAPARTGQPSAGHVRLDSTTSTNPTVTMEPIPSPPQPADLVDLGDLIILADAPTNHYIRLSVQPDGTVDFNMPREENGQGLVTGVAMLIADELDVPLDKVNVTLADAEPKLIFNQITGGSSGMRSLFQPVRTAAAIARSQLLSTAASRWGVATSDLAARDGVVYGPGGESMTYGELSPLAASPVTTEAVATPKDVSEYKIVGTPVSQLANRDIVTGRQKYTADLDVADAKPTMVRRAPTQQGTLEQFLNRDAVLAMPGVLDVATFPFGVAVRGETFGQVIDAVNAVEATWHPGPLAGQDDQTVLAALEGATLPLVVPELPPELSLLDVTSLEAEFDWAYVNHAPLEPNVAIADVRPDRAEIWSPLQNPIVTLQVIARDLGLAEDQVTVHVIRGGGSFGRTLWYDAAKEAAMISKAVGKPVKLMWHRTNDMRQGRGHPQSYHKMRATILGGSVLSYEHRVTSVQTNINPGLGEIFTRSVDKLPFGETGFDQTLFLTTVTCPYNFGVVDELLNEIPLEFWTSSWRSVYSYDTRCSEEIFVDQIAAAMGQDPLAFRLAFLKSDKVKALLQKVADVGEWGREMPAGWAQGICANTRDRSDGACLVEMDATDPSNPRVTKAVIAVDARFPVNPRSIEGQQLGGLNDAISVVLTASNPVKAGLPVPDGWSEYGQTRQGNYPIEVQVFVAPPDGDTPGGIGEIGVPNTAGAIANAYIRATGIMPKSFPINPVEITDTTPPGLLAPQPNLPLPAPGDYYNY